MTREEAAELLPIIKAFSEGKDIEYFDTGSNIWRKSINPLFGDINYRIKPSPTYRPFANAEECWQEMQKHQPCGWVKRFGNPTQIITLDENTVTLVATVGKSLTLYYSNCTDITFADGSVFGIKEEREE